jgi:hypothetical protein
MVGGLAVVVTLRLSARDRALLEQLVQRERRELEDLGVEVSLSSVMPAIEVADNAVSPQDAHCDGDRWDEVAQVMADRPPSDAGGWSLRPEPGVVSFGSGAAALLVVRNNFDSVLARGRYRGTRTAAERDHLSSGRRGGRGQVPSNVGRR